jgi:glycosyltransferase involved in cell wall biosynthesis
MKILWSIHLYPPDHNCGSEWMAHNINKFLISKGHHVRVILHQALMHKVHTPYMLDGVEVFPPSGQVDAYRWADVVMTHLDYTQFTILMGHEAKRPVVHFIHNDIPYDSVMNAQSRNNVVYNSKWIAEKLKYNWPSMVLHPPCDVDQYNVCENPFENEYITLISLNENKGGKQFYEIAERMPERKFMGVVGSYDPQIVRHDLPNVTIVPNTPDILSVYRKTRILLMPSKYESWGRTATEAMCSGIPVICTPTPGLTENCGEAGIYIKNRNNIDSWIHQIKLLDKKEKYGKVSAQVRARAQELRPENELNQLENFLYQTLN